MNSSLDKKVKKIIFDFIFKNNLIFATKDGKNWSLYPYNKKSDFKEENCLTKEDFISLDAISFRTPNWNINLCAQKIFKEIIQKLEYTEKLDFFSYHGLFCNFKQALNTISSIDKDLGLLFFEKGNDITHYYKVLDANDEKIVLENAFNLCKDPEKFVPKLLSYLKNKSDLYINRVEFQTRQFVLKDFIKKYLPNINESLFNHYLKTFETTPYTNNIFVLEDEKSYLLNIDKALLYNHYPLPHIESSKQYHVYNKMIDCMISFLNNNMAHRGIKSCVQNYSNKNDSYCSLLIVLQGQNQIALDDVKLLITTGIKYLANNANILNDNEQVNKLLSTFWKLELNEQLAKDLPIANNLSKKTKL